MDALCSHRRPTREVHVGSVTVGGNAPISIQSMTTTDTHDAKKTIAQAQDLFLAGADIVRVTLPDKAAFPAFSKICTEAPGPIVADIHFDATLALLALDSAASAIRINPGNIGKLDKVDAIFTAAKEKNKAVRIGVNAGSLEADIEKDQSLTLSQKLAKSAKRFSCRAEALGFTNYVVSAKVHSVKETIDANKELAKKLPEVPLHLGVTEAGDAIQGTVKNAVALSALLREGIGDTIRISLTEDPCLEVEAARVLLASLDLRRIGPEFITCPTCGRTKVDLIALTKEARARFSRLKKPLSIAIMGCAVNGPGEAKAADIGVAFGDGYAAIFESGNIVERVSSESALDALEKRIDAS